VLAGGCTPKQYSQQADKSAYGVVAAKQKQVLGASQPFQIAYRPFAAEDVESGLGGAAQPTTQPATQPSTQPARVLGLDECLQIAARNSRPLQTRKETLYISALALANLRHQWSRVFGNISGTAGVSRTGDGPTVYDGSGNANLSFAQQFASGGALTLAAGLNAATNFLNIQGTSFGSLLDANFTQPLWRGGGRGLAYEDLYRSERDFAIAILEYERFVQTFAIGIASSYYRVLQQ
jgi:hypothetical protein